MANIYLIGANQSFDSDVVIQVLLQGDEVGNEILIIFLGKGGTVSAPASKSNISTILNAGFHIYQYNTKDKQKSMVAIEVKASSKYYKSNKNTLSD